MLRHVVLFAWKAETTPEKIKEIERAFIDLPKTIDLIHDFEWGIDVSTENLTHGFTHCFFVTFKSREDRDAYLPHPEHSAFVEMMKPYMKDVLVIDYWKP